jgi:hypothetical protein
MPKITWTSTADVVARSDMFQENCEFPVRSSNWYSVKLPEK